MQSDGICIAVRFIRGLERLNVRNGSEQEHCRKTQRADNSDIVKIIGKPAMVKKMLEENGNVNFQSTPMGGWY